MTTCIDITINKLITATAATRGAGLNHDVVFSFSGMWMKRAYGRHLNPEVEVSR